jgi:hypothetical protein
MNPFGFVVLAAAIFALVAAAAGWERFRIGLFGRSGTRLFYVLVGLGLAWLAIMMLVNSGQ